MKTSDDLLEIDKLKEQYEHLIVDLQEQKIKYIKLNMELAELRRTYEKNIKDLLCSYT